jgi:hypothetical protein
MGSPFGVGATFDYAGLQGRKSQNSWDESGGSGWNSGSQMAQVALQKIEVMLKDSVDREAEDQPLCTRVDAAESFRHPPTAVDCFATRPAPLPCIAAPTNSGSITKPWSETGSDEALGCVQHTGQT